MKEQKEIAFKKYMMSAPFLMVMWGVMR